VSEIEGLIKKYAEVRNDFEDLKNKHPKYLAGNDNYIGIIGEYWAIKFIEQIKPEAIKDFLEDRKENNISKSKKWVDLEIKNNDSAIEYINVKAISEENKKGESGKIKLEDRPKNGICSIIIVKLNDKLFPDQLLYIEDIEKNLLDKGLEKYKSKPKQHIYFKYNKDLGFDNNDHNFKDNIRKYEDNKFIKI